MIPGDTNSIRRDHMIILGDQIPSPMVIHTKVTIEPHFVLKKWYKRFTEILGSPRNGCMHGAN
jgi:hypothetical protein